jgi:putative ABC transport system permease protein
MMAITLERRRDLALLRVAGATRSQAVGLVVGDSLLVGLAGASVGVLLALPVSAFMTAILSDTFGWMIDRTLTGAPIWIFLGVLAVSGAAGLLPALAVRRIAPAESLLAD